MIKINNKKISNNEIKNQLINIKNDKNIINNFWDNQSDKIINEFLNKNPKNFLKFKSIGETMFVGRRTKYIYLELINLIRYKNYFKKIKNLLFCNNFGKPATFPINILFRNTNSNMIHQAYHLLKLKQETNINLDEIENIFEFGGGYGSLCKIFDNEGFKGNYYIYDLPLMSYIQNYWITNSNFINLKNIYLINDTENIPEIKNNIFGKKNLFISNWALSESPIELRNKFTDFFKYFEYISLAIQNNFQGVDNISYIDELKKDLLHSANMFLFEKKINHIKNSSYIYGMKI